MSSNMNLDNTILAGVLLQENVAAGDSREETDKLRVATPTAGGQVPDPELADAVESFNRLKYGYVASISGLNEIFDIPTAETERLIGHSVLHSNSRNPFPSSFQRNGESNWYIFDVLRWWQRRNDEIIIRVIYALVNAASRRAKTDKDDASTDPVLKVARKVLTPIPENDGQRICKYAEIVCEMFNTGITDEDAQDDFLEWIAEEIVGLEDEEEASA